MILVFRVLEVVLEAGYEATVVDSSLLEKPASILVSTCLYCKKPYDDFQLLPSLHQPKKVALQSTSQPSIVEKILQVVGNGLPGYSNHLTIG